MYFGDPVHGYALYCHFGILYFAIPEGLVGGGGLVFTIH